jgi:histidinol-phosphate aminotransferase
MTFAGAPARHHDLDPARIDHGMRPGRTPSSIAGVYAGPKDEVIYVRYGFTAVMIAKSGVLVRHPLRRPIVTHGTNVDAIVLPVNRKDAAGLRRESKQPRTGNLHPP